MTDNDSQVPPILQGLEAPSARPKADDLPDGAEVETLTPTDTTAIDAMDDATTAAADEEPEVDPKKTFKRVAWGVGDVLGVGEFQDIYWRPDGVPEEYPMDWLPGIRFKRVNDVIMTTFQRIHNGRGGQGGDPDRAQQYLLKTCLVSFLNMPDALEDSGCESEYEYLLTTEDGRKLKGYALTEFIVREVPSVAQGKVSGKRFKRS